MSYVVCIGVGEIGGKEVGFGFFGFGCFIWGIVIYVVSFISLFRIFGADLGFRVFLTFLDGFRSSRI